MAYQYKYHGKNKYHNRKTTIGSTTFDSTKEARRYATLRLLEEAGEITDLRTQVKYEVIPVQKDPETGKVIERAAHYIADFVYTDRMTGETVVEDTKGYRTKEYILKRKLMLKEHGIRIKEV